MKMNKKKLINQLLTCLIGRLKVSPILSAGGLRGLLDGV